MIIFDNGHFNLHKVLLVRFLGSFYAIINYQYIMYKIAVTI